MQLLPVYMLNKYPKYPVKDHPPPQMKEEYLLRPIEHAQAIILYNINPAILDLLEKKLPSLGIMRD